METKAMKKKSKQSIATKFAYAAGTLLLISFICQGLLNSLYVKKKTENLYDEYVNALLDCSTASIEYWLEGSIDNATVFAQSETFIEHDFDYIANYLIEYKDLFNDIFDYAGIVDLKGNMKTSNGGTAQVADRDYFQLVVSGAKDVAIDDPVKARSSDKIVFHIAVPVKDQNGKLKQVFVAMLETKTMQEEITNKIKIGKEGYAYLVCSDGSIMTNNTTGASNVSATQNVDFNNFVGLKELVVQMKARKSGKGLVINRESKQKTEVSFQPIEYTNWSLAISVPVRQVGETARGAFQFILVLSIVSVIILTFIFIAVILVLIKPLKKVKGAISEIASGDADLTKTIDVTSHDEVGDVVENFNAFTSKLRSIMSELKTSKEGLITAGEDLEASSEDTSSSITEIIANIESVHNQIETQAASVTETASAVNEIASNIDSLEKMIETQSSGVTQASAAIEQMIGNISSVKNSMDKMAESFDDLTEKAHTGSNLQTNVNDQIERIKSQSETLQDANQAIADIAEQTNLLAMNAAIEAAHAGEAGKGFSVVADEIRKLSETSADQSRTIGEQLNQIQSLIETVVNVSTESSNAFQSVAGKISETDEIVRQIKIALDEQTEGSKQINDALLAMNNSTSEVRNASLEMSSGNKAILEEVQRLQDATSSMKDSMIEMSVGARKINESGAVLQTISKTIKESIDEMGNQVDKFKV